MNYDCKDCDFGVGNAKAIYRHEWDDKTIHSHPQPIKKDDNCKECKWLKVGESGLGADYIWNNWGKKTYHSHVQPITFGINSEIIKMLEEAMKKMLFYEYEEAFDDIREVYKMLKDIK